MAKAGDCYTVEVKNAHIKWGTYRKTFSRNLIDGESYVKIPADSARKFNIKRGDTFKAHFDNYDSINIKASGNGPTDGNIVYAKQFEGIGQGACKAFTPWYIENNISVGDTILVEFTSDKDIKFTKI